MSEVKSLTVKSIIATIRAVAENEKWSNNDLTLRLCDAAEAAEARAETLLAERDQWLARLQTQEYIERENAKLAKAVRELAAQLEAVTAERDAAQKQVETLTTKLDAAWDVILAVDKSLSDETPLGQALDGMGDEAES